MKNVIIDNFNEILYATHNAIREGIKEYDIKKCDVILPQNFKIETIYQGVKIDKYYDLSCEITQQVLNYSLREFIDNIITPATHAMIFYNIDSYCRNNNNNIVLPIKESNTHITLYKDNIGIGVSYIDNIFNIEILCGYII